MNDVLARGVVVAKGGLPHLSFSTNVAAIIDNGIGSYQIIFERPIKESYSLIATARDTADERGVVINERGFWQRSNMDCLIELRDSQNQPVDADFNFAIIGEADG